MSECRYTAWLEETKNILKACLNEVTVENTKLKVENVKLRELVCDLWHCATTVFDQSCMYCDRDPSGHGELVCHPEFARRIAELGIEVEE